LGCSAGAYGFSTARGLHAKVYVFGKAAAIGSANASRHSADVLLEAMVVTTDAKMVSEARHFVEGIAKDEFGPRSLKRLAKFIARHAFRRTWRAINQRIREFL
jgi:phosphatidylserine/phosphatidylglycerophosphate/cardiolipin synthase-like enzyme